MDIAYKYCSSRGVEILRTLELKITPPNEFNDPFEFTPRMICSAPLRRTKEILKTKRHLKRLYEADKTAGIFTGNFRDYRLVARKDRDKIAQEISDLLPFAAANVQRTILNKASQKYGILCLSETRESILMWGHYSEKHLGLVIGFDAAHSVFRGAKGLTKLTYTRDRVIFDASWLQQDSRLHAFERQLVYSKNIDWSYEHELRQMFNLSALKQKPLGDGTPGFFLPLPPQAILNVTLGARCSEDLRREIQSALRNDKLAHVIIERAVLHDGEFALTFAPVGRG